MKSKLYAALTYFTLILPLFAQYEWSNPIQLSNDGIYPVGYLYPAITVDNNGVIYSFWVYIQPENGDSFPSYSQIEYRKSTDGGLTWSSIENLTPEYTEEGKRIYDIRAVCDSNNNIHLFYQRGYASPYDICYKKYDGVSWTNSEILANNGNVKLLANIDSNDRIYLTWVNYDTHYVYCNINEANPMWSEQGYIFQGNHLSTSNYVFDKNNNIYAIGTIDSDPENYRPYYYFYERSLEDWTLCIPICNYQTKSLGKGIALSNNDSVFVNVSVGYSLAENTDDHLKKALTDSEFTLPITFGENNNWSREMYIDECNYIHLFVKHYYQAGNTNGAMGLHHNICKNGTWSTVIIDSSKTHSYTDPRVAFDKHNNKFYTIYSKVDRTNSVSRIFIRYRQNESGIENDDGFISEDYELYQNYPNPFNNQTKIEYSIGNVADVEIEIYNIKGELIRSYLNKNIKSGTHSILVNFEKYNSGIYFYNLKLNGKMKDIRKMLFLE